MNGTVIPFKRAGHLFLKKISLCNNMAVADIADLDKDGEVVTSLCFEKDAKFGWCISGFANCATHDSNMLADLVQRALMIISGGEYTTST